METKWKPTGNKHNYFQRRYVINCVTETNKQFPPFYQKKCIYNMYIVHKGVSLKAICENPHTYRHINHTFSVYMYL